MKELNTIDIIFLLLKVTFSDLQLVLIFSQSTVPEMHNSFYEKTIILPESQFS